MSTILDDCFTVPFAAECLAGKLRMSAFTVFGLTLVEIELESTVSVAEGIFTSRLID